MATGFAPAGVIFIAKGTDSFLRTFKKINSTFNNFNKKAGATADSFGRFENQLRTLGTVTLAGLTAGILALSVAVGALALSGLNTAISFESAFADVTKTVDAFVDRTATAEDGVIRLTEEGQKFRDEIKTLSNEIPVAFEQLSNIAGLGGQLGIVEGLAGDDARRALLAFTETVAGLAEATNLTQQVAATGLAQISNIFRDDVQDIGLNIEQLGSTLVELGNTSAATESLILNFARRIAGTGKTVGLTQAEVLGLGTAFASIGITAEAGSTAVNRSLLIMNEAVALSSETFADNTMAIGNTQEEISDLQADLVRLEAQTGITGKSLVAQKEAFLEAGGAVEDWGRKLGDARREQLFQTQTAVDQLTSKLNVLRITQGQALTTEVFDELLRVVQQTQKGAELTAETFRDLFTDDPAEAFTLFVEGLAEDGNRAGETLDRIGLGSVEATRAFLAIAGASDTVRDRILASTKAFEENRALVEEVSIRYATLRSNIQELLNVIRGVSDTLFSPLIEPAARLVEWGKEVVLVFGESVPRVFEAISNKFGPELMKIFEGLFGTAERQLDLTNISFDEAILLDPVENFAGRMRTSIEGVADAIDNLDVSNLSDQVIEFRDKIVPIWVSATTFVTENTDIFIGAIKGLTALLAGAALVSAFTHAAAFVGLLATPLGTVGLLVVSFGIAWETNFLKIQEVTDNVVTSVKGSISDLLRSFGSIETEDLMGGGLDLSGLTTAAEKAIEIVGNLTTLVVQVPVDQIGGLIEMFNGLVTIVDSLTSASGTAEEALEGLRQVASGFVDVLTAPLQNLAKFFGFEFDVTAIKDAAFNAAKNFIEGFIAGFAGADVVDLGDNFTELFNSILALGESGGVQVFLAGLVQMGEGLSDLFEAIGVLSGALKELIGLEPDDSLITFIGSIVGFVAKVGVDEVINLIEMLTGLTTVLTGLLNLDFETVTEGLEIFGGALLGFIIDPFTRVLELASPEFKLQMAQLALDGLDSFQTSWDQGFVIMDMGMSISEWITGLNTSMTTGINDLIADIQALFAVNLDLDDLVDFTPWIEGLRLSFFGFFVDLDKAITIAADNLGSRFFGILSPIDLGLPSFQSILDKSREISDKIKTFFTNLFEGITFDLPEIDFDFGILEKLAELGFIDLEVQAPDADGIGSGLAQGIIDEVEDAEQTWKDAWLDFLLTPIEVGKEALGIESPSTVTQKMAEDVIAGYALGLSDLTPIETALIGVNDTILTAFANLSTELTGRTIPTIQATDQVFIALYSDTLPRTTSALVDDLIPAKLELSEVNTEDLVPSVDLLIEVEETLINTLEDVIIVLDRLVSLKERAKSRSKSLTEQIDKLAKAYLSLAAAIGAASQAGDGLTSAPNVPVAPASGTPFQTGGSFIVPSNVGSGGMPIRVHANELVQIIPAQDVPISVKSPKISGASTTNLIANNQQANTSSTKEFHLHVSEAPTSDVRDSFDLMETLS